MPDPEAPPVGDNAPRSRSRRWIVLALAALLVAGVALGLWRRDLLWTKPARPADATPANPGYVGPRVCAECHAARLAEFQRTRHFVACTPASGARAPGFAPNRGTHLTQDSSLRFEMTRTGGELFATAVQDTPGGERRKTYHVGLVYGAGGSTDEMYFAWEGDRLYNLPVAWLFPYDRWGHAFATAEAREVAPNCLECHNTWVAHVPGSSNQYRRDGMILGVTCERCHGPADKHVEYHRAHPDGPAQAILHPGTLDRERLIEVCTQCHGNLKLLGPAFSYRPGQPLLDTHRIVHTRRPEDDQVADQIHSLRQSKCFQKSQMTCTTCHDPHRPQKPAEVRRACLSCHTAASCSEQPRLPEAVRGDCAGCHAPQRVWMNVRYHTTDDQYVPVMTRADHRFAVHPEAKQAVLLTWLRTQKDDESRAEAERLATQLSEHWLAEAERRARANRLLGTIGAVREALKVRPSAAARQRLKQTIERHAEFDRLVLAGNAAGQRDPGATIHIMKQILAIRPDYAPALGELGTAYAMLGDGTEAVAQLRAGAEADPEDSYCVATLAALAAREGRYQDASKLYEKADEIDPGNAGYQHGWGQALARQGRRAEAEEHFRRALQIDPNHVGASESLNELSRHSEPARAEGAGRRLRFAGLLVLVMTVLLGGSWWALRKRKRPQTPQG